MYKIPKEGLLKKIIQNIFNENKKISSLALFEQLIRRELKKYGPDFKVSRKRILKISTFMDDVKVYVLKSKSPTKLEKCPFCGTQMEGREVINLYGKKTHNGKKCPQCRFKINNSRVKPKRYIFYFSHLL